MLPADILPPDFTDELAEDVVSFSGPATDEQIERAENELRVSFPASFRRFLLRFGAGRFRWLDVFGIPQDRERLFVVGIRKESD